MQALIECEIDTIRTTNISEKYFGIELASIIYTPNIAMMKGGIQEMKHYFNDFNEIKAFVESFL